MGGRSYYIVYFLDFVLLIFCVAVCCALFSLGDRVLLPALPTPAKVAAELVFYVAVLFFFYSERHVDVDIWIRSFIVFILIRMITSMLNGFLFSVIAGGQVNFSTGFQLAFYGNTAVYAIEVLSTPFLAFPVVFGYVRTQTEKRIEEEFAPLWEEDEVELVPPSPGELEVQVVPGRVWRQVFESQDAADIKALLKGVRISDYFRNLAAPQRAEAGSEILELLRGMVPEGGELSAAEELPETPSEEAPQAPPQPVPEVETPAPQEAPSAQSPQPAPELEEISKLMELEPFALEEGGEAAAEEAQPEAPPAPEEAAPPAEAPLPELEVPLEVPEAPQAPGLPEAPVELPTELPEAPAPAQPEAKPEEEVAPQPQAPPPKTEAPKPEGGYEITSPDDFYRISLRKLIELNSGKQSAQVLSRLIKRGANFELAVPMRMLIPQLQQGKATLTVEYVYSEIPIELVNFMSSDQSGDLSELELDLPLDDIMSKTDPKVIFGDRGPQEESKWAQASESVDIESVFEGLAESGGEEEPIVEEEGKVLDLTSDAASPPQEPSEEEPSGFPQELLDFASRNGVTPMLEEGDKVCVVLLQPVGVSGGALAPVAQWAATKKLSDNWEKTPCYVFVDSDVVSVAIAIAPGLRTKRDALVLVVSPKELPELKGLVDEACGALGASESPQDVELEPVEPLPFHSEREIKDVEGYQGAWTKLPGKMLGVVSAVSGDEDHLGAVAALGNEFAQLISGAGRILAGWQRALLHAQGWTLALMPMPGGVIVAELPKDKPVQEAPLEVQRLSQALLGAEK